MALFGLVSRGQLPQVVEDEFESLIARLRRLWLVEHNEDGTHIPKAIYHMVGVTIDGGGVAITTGTKGMIQVPFKGTIVGWSAIAKESGSIAIDVNKKFSLAPPTAPAIPNTTTDLISGLNPIRLTSQQSASGDISKVSAWIKTVTPWDVFQFNVTAVTTITNITAYVLILQT